MYVLLTEDGDIFGRSTPPGCRGYKNWRDQGNEREREMHFKTGD